MTDAQNSALIHPDQCCLLFVDFVGLPVSGDDRSASLRNLHRELLAMAEQLSVPIFASTRPGEDGFEIEASLREFLSRQNSLARTCINPWKDKRLRDWIFDLDRNRLVLAGGCSEGSLMQAALGALEDMYDVYVLFDLSDDRLVAEGSPMARRMIQAGVVPMTTRQLLFEWKAAVNGGVDASE